MVALLEAGANLEVQNESGNTPLHLAALGGTAEAVMALLGAGAPSAARHDHPPVLSGEHGRMSHAA